MVFVLLTEWRDHPNSVSTGESRQDTGNDTKHESNPNPRGVVEERCGLLLRGWSAAAHAERRESPVIRFQIPHDDLGHSNTENSLGEQSKQ